MSRTDTWMPLYIGDYLADTGRLSATGHGVYLLILMDYWRNGPPPDDDAVLCEIGRVSRRVWNRDLRAVIRSFFSVGDDGCLHQKRLDKERAHAIDLSEKRRTAAKAKGGSREPDRGSNCSANAGAIAEQLPDLLVTHARVAVPSPSPSQEEKKEPKAAPLGAIAPSRDPNKEFYDQAVPLVISLTGMSRTAAGGFLVKLVKRAKDNRSCVLSALRDADEQRPLQPQSWLMGAVEARASPKDKLSWFIEEAAELQMKLGGVH